jgi:predicted dehydrogenase
VNFAIIGCGLIGQKRLKSLTPGHRLVAVADTDQERARALAAQAPGAVAYPDWKDALRRGDIDSVVVATTNDALASVTRAAVEAGKHVLVEKPAARTPGELQSVIAIAEKAGTCVRVGFNHRFHPAFIRAHELFRSGQLGALMYVRARYGHGGRIGYEKEWRARPEVAGGGELLDQGVHLIDLSRWFLGDFVRAEGHVATFFWDMPVEDNGFLLLHTEEGQIAWLHASCTEWKNTFSFEVYGRNAKLHIEGLGGSYGTERLAYYSMKPEMGPPDTTIWEFPGEDTSWRAELAAFSEAIASGGGPAATLRDAQAALEVVSRIYAGSRSDMRQP